MNPSLELVVNGRDVVIAAEPVNDDGAMVLEGNDLVGKDCREALECLVQSEAFAGFVDETSYLEFGVVCDDEQRSLRLIEKCEAASAAATCETACATASEAERLAAQEAGMGVGRYRLALELTQQDSSLTLEDCAHMTMRELRDELGEDDMRGDGQAGGQAGGHGGGHGYQKGSQSQ